MSLKAKVLTALGACALVAGAVVPAVELGPSGGPLRGSGSCAGGDQSTALSTYFANRPNGSTVTLANKCYEINSSVLIQSKSNLTIHGNGAVFEQDTSPAPKEPILRLLEDTKLKIDGLTVEGAYDGTNGGPGAEKDAGIAFEGDNGITISNSTVENTQGDGVYLSPPYDLFDSDKLNTNVTMSADRITNTGYHGLTIESTGCWTLAPCNGFMLTNSTMTSLGTDAMDFEVDTYSTPFNSDGTPYFFAEDYVTISNDVWNGWASDWLAALQGQTPGVRFQHLVVTGNTLNDSKPIFEVTGTDPRSTTLPYDNYAWTIKNNSFGPGYHGTPYHGGLTSAAQLYNIVDLDIENNFFPLCAGAFESPQPQSLCGGPDYYFVDLNAILGGSIKNNNLNDAEGVATVSGSPPGTVPAIPGMKQCGNKYGAGGTSVDASC